MDPHREESPSPAPASPVVSQSAGKPPMSGERKLILGLAGALVVVAIAMFGWKAAAVKAVEERMAQAEVQHKQARAQLLDKAHQADAQRSLESLRRFSTPFAWAVRREVMANNLDQVDQYFTELVQQPGFQSAVMAKPDGQIVVASDRKRLAENFSSLYPAAYLQAADIRVEPADNGVLRAIIPIMGLNQHLSTVVLEYTPPAYALE